MVTNVPANRWLPHLNVALAVTTILMVFTTEEIAIILFHVIFFFLTLGAFFWQFRTFVVQSILWVTITTLIVIYAVFNNSMHSEELVEIPLLTAILILVHVIAGLRMQAEEALRRSYEALESRVEERTAELKQLNIQLTEEITQHKQTEKSLRESEERYRHLIKLSFEAITVHGGGKFLYLNKPAAKLLGASDPAELIDKPINAFIHPDYLQTVNSRVQRVKQAGQGAPLVEEKFIRLDGGSVDVEVASVAVTHKGQPAIQTVIRDITPRKQAEAEREQLLKTEREQRLLAETLGEVFLTLTSQLSYEVILDEILHQVKRIVSHRAANIVLLKNKTLHVVRHQGYTNTSIDDLKQPLTDFPLDAKVIETRQPLIVTDTQQAPEWVFVPELSWIQASIAVPICLRDQVLGLLRLDSDQGNAFSEKHIKRLQPLADAAAIALENARLYDQARQEIADRIQIEEELRRTAAKNRAILDAIPDSILHLDRRGKILDYKLHTTTISQSIFADVGHNDSMDNVLPSDLSGLVLQYIDRTLKTETPQIFECQLPDRQDARDFEIRLVRSGRNDVIAIMRDITERKAQATALERERARIARDLHDTLGQSLGYLHLKLDEFTSEGIVLTDNYVKQQLVQMRDITNEAYEIVRSMLAAARPSNSLDLAEALLAQAKSAGSQARFQVNLKAQGQPCSLSPIVQHQVLYLFQEALSNVAKHAQASQVDLTLNWTEEQLTITLTDDGIGFEIDAPRPDNHFGLTIMEERAEEINGFLTISSTPNQGTRLLLRLPLNRLTAY